ncbi:MAG: hypothetical protein FWC32_11775 [Firmicutes bacterium]|nr:hypothetical protein [Bacillota bacterium]
MKRKTTVIFLTIVIAMVFAGCSGSQENNELPDAPEDAVTLVEEVTDEYICIDIPTEIPEELTYVLEPVFLPSTGLIHLYGEWHGNVDHVNKQFERWMYYYTHHNMRHLFVELPFFTAEFLNIWMTEDNDDILDALFVDLRGTLFYAPINREFLQRVKNELPETIFHGTDIGHKYQTTGYRFLYHLRDNGLEGSEKYRLAFKNIEQGKLYYVYRTSRPDMMVENFIREFDRLQGESVMSAFYGALHVALGYCPDGGGLTMAQQLKNRYGDNVRTTILIMEGTPDVIVVGGVEYRAAFFGEEDFSRWSDRFVKREVWRLEDAYDDFKNHPVVDNVLPFSEFPMPVELGQVFIIKYTMYDGSTVVEYHRSSGAIWEGRNVTQEFLVD